MEAGEESRNSSCCQLLKEGSEKTLSANLKKGMERVKKKMERSPSSDIADDRELVILACGGDACNGIQQALRIPFFCCEKLYWEPLHWEPLLPIVECRKKDRSGESHEICRACCFLQD